MAIQTAFWCQRAEENGTPLIFASRHGDVEVTVIIEGGRITAAAISRCLTRYSCSWIAHLQPQVAERQSPEVDNVSGATESADAFYYAVVEALKAAKP